MKVKCQYGIKGMVGKKDGAVFYYHPRLKQYLMRAWVKTKKSAATDRAAAIMRNVANLQPSDAYKDDLRNYIYQYNELKDYAHKPLTNWNNAFLKLLYAMQKQYETVDLETLTRDQIYSEELPCITLKLAIEAGLLPKVKHYESFVAEL